MMEILRCGHVLYVTQHSTQRVLTATAWARTCRFSQHEGATNGDTAPHRLQPLTVHDAIPPTREAANEVARNAQERASLDRECARDLVVRERVAMEVRVAELEQDPVWPHDRWIKLVVCAGLVLNMICD